MPTYQPLIPTGTVPLNQDYQNLQGNFQVADTSFGTDHYAFSDATANNGYHKVAHFVATSTVASNPPNNFPITPPPTVGLTGELFTTQSNVGLGNDELLWWQSGGGTLAQMTVNLTPVSSTNGYTFIPGGLILQWGIVSSTSGSGTVTFPIAFPQAVFNITFGMIVTSGSSTTHAGQVYVKAIPSLTNSSFGWRQADLSPDATGFFWSAIGN